MTIPHLHLLSPSENDILFNSFIHLIKKGHLDLLPQFLELGVDIHKDNDFALQQSIYAGHNDIALYLIKSGCRNNDCLVWAAGSGNKELLIKLIKMGARNEAAIIEAAKMGHLDIVKYLHTWGSDIHIAKEAPLQWSIKNGHIDIADYLLKHNCDIHVADEFCLRHSVLGKHVELTKKLIDMGANIKEKGFLLSDSVENNCLPMVELLVASGIDVNRYNSDAFSVAAFHNTQEIGVFLLTHHINIIQAKAHFIQSYQSEIALNKLYSRWDNFMHDVNLKLVHHTLNKHLKINPSSSTKNKL